MNGSELVLAGTLIGVRKHQADGAARRIGIMSARDVENTWHGNANWYNDLRNGIAGH